jgi:hypothetical protein
MSFLKSKHSGWTHELQRTPFSGGGSGGSPAPTQSTAYNTNIPEYARPYVENMLQSAQTQVYNDDMTSFRPYNPYSSDPNNYFAEFSPLQQSAQESAYYMQTPGQFGMASELAGQAGMGGMDAQGNAGMLGSEALGYGQAGANYGQAGQMYGSRGAEQAGINSRNAMLQAENYGQGAVDTGRQSLGYGQQGVGYGAEAAAKAQQGYGAGDRFAKQATDPNATQAYMSPYMQNVVDYQKSQAVRDFQKGQGMRQAKAVGAGAFGGSRQALENSEAQRNLNSQLQGIEATGAQEAFKNAQDQQRFGANVDLQGLQAGYQGTGMGIQGVNAGMQGVQGALAGYNTGMQGVGQQINAGNLNLAGTAQGIQGAQAGMQGAGVGLQGVGQATNAGQYGLQGLNTANTSAGTLGTLGTQDLASRQSITNLQNTMGGQQQTLEQNKINQAIQDYAIQQQYPMMQLGFMSNMLRGLPMQSQTTQLYQAQPSSLQQGIGLLGAGASLYGAGRAAGGEIKEMAEGGIVGYKYGGAIPEAKLAGMAQNLSVEQLKQRLADKELDSGERQIFADALADKSKDKARYAGLGAAGGGLFNTMGYAGGGILAFADEGVVKDPEELANQINLIGAQLDAVNKEAGGRTAPGSKQRAFQPQKVAEFENLKKRQSELQSEYSDLMSKAGLDKPAIGYRSGVAPTTLYPNNTEQALLGTKPPETKAMPTAGEFKAFDEATERYLAEQKAKPKPPGAAGPSTGAEGSKPSGAPGGVGTKADSGLSGILAGLRKEGPKGELGSDYIKTLEENLAGADKRMSKADKLAMAKGFLKFGATPAPGGIGQAAIAGLGEYTDQYGKAIESDEKYKADINKQKQDILALQRAEERGDVKLAAEIQEKIADRANRLQTANISAAASGRAGAREDAYVKQLMGQGMSLEQALQVVKGAGKAESNDIARAKAALTQLNEEILTMKKDDPRRAALITQRDQITQMLMSGGGSQTAGGGGGIMRFDAQGNLVKG